MTRVAVVLVRPQHVCGEYLAAVAGVRMETVERKPWLGVGIPNGLLQEAVGEAHMTGGTVSLLQAYAGLDGAAMGVLLAGAGRLVVRPGNLDRLSRRRETSCPVHAGCLRYAVARVVSEWMDDAAASALASWTAQDRLVDHAGGDR